MTRGISILKAPFPWFGGKRRCAHLVWPRFGEVPNYVEPFAGSLAVMLARPHEAKNETVNDMDCYLSNWWRAVQHDPAGVAFHADWPVNEADLHARHQWLHDQAGFREKMKSDPDFYDAKIAGWWVWGLSAWIGGGWCHPRPCAAAPNTFRSKGVHAKYCRALETYFERLAVRLRRVRVCCGDWKRILGPSPTIFIGVTAVFLDPPYGVSDRDKVYNHDSRELAGEVRAWCREHGDEPKLRIALCGYAGEHDELEKLGWQVVAWKAGGGYGAITGKNHNAERERIWFSKSCLDAPEQAELFEEVNCE